MTSTTRITSSAGGDGTSLDAEQWLHLAERQADYLIRTEYRGVERRTTPRYLARVPGAILLERDSLVDCTVRDFSPAGVGYCFFLPAEFDLTFRDAIQPCITVWRHTERMGLKFKST
jgi:hypothetical protein